MLEKTFYINCNSEIINFILQKDFQHHDIFLAQHRIYYFFYIHDSLCNVNLSDFTLTESRQETENCLNNRILRLILS